MIDDFDFEISQALSEHINFIERDLNGKVDMLPGAATLEPDFPFLPDAQGSAILKYQRRRRKVIPRGDFGVGEKMSVKSNRPVEVGRFDMEFEQSHAKFASTPG